MSAYSVEPAPEDLPRVATDEAAGNLLASLLRVREMAVEQPGDIIGPYRLAEKLGDGGFGTVWRAEQSEPVRRAVAFKIIKLGMDTLEIMARFEQERQALARMDHPGIARVFDAGATPEGRPFFVMEMVRGVPVTQYCIEQRLPLRRRLELFTLICHAVQHAHQKGVIHRDLKPSNILVADVDGVPTPKVIDFGIAKAVTKGTLAEYALVTRQEQLLGTPLYMSPEQVSGGVLDIDTHSDVYSLGALLYELLTGAPPFDVETLLGAGQVEMCRIIREVDPVPPSRRLSAEARLTQGAKTTASLPASDIRGASLRGDLDWVVMKALEKDRARRYASPTSLAEDVQRYLASEPVGARPPSTGYLLGRWVRRHRVGFAAACISVLALLSGTGVAIWQAVRATSSETVAKAQTAVAVAQTAEALKQLKAADEVAALVTGMLTTFNVTTKGRQLDEEELFAEMVKQVRAFQGDPLRKAQLLVALGGARGYGGSNYAFDEAEKLVSPLLPPDDPFLWDIRYGVAIDKVNVSATRAEGVKLLRQVYEWRRDHIGPERSSTVSCILILGRHLNSLGRYQESLPLLELASLAIGRSSAQKLVTSVKALIKMAYGDALFHTGKQEEGLTMSREGYDLLLAKASTQYSELASASHRHGVLCREAGRLDEAAKALRLGVNYFWKAFGPDTVNVQVCLNDLFELLRERQDVEGGIALRRELVRELDARLGAANSTTIKHVGWLVNALLEAHRIQEARGVCEEWRKKVCMPDGSLPPSCEALTQSEAKISEAQKQASGS